MAWLDTPSTAFEGSRCIASGSNDQTIRLWDTNTGTPLQILQSHHNRIWAALDKVLAKYPDMVLFHGGNPTGGEHIASLWARARKITHVPFRPDWERFKKAAPFRRNDQMLEVLPKAVVACPGNGINANLVDKARRMGIYVWTIE